MQNMHDMERTTIPQAKGYKRYLKLVQLQDSCKCGSQFHKFFRNVAATALRTCSTQKKSTHWGVWRQKIQKSDSASITQAPQFADNPNPDLFTMQQYCEVNVLSIKWRISVTSSLCDAGFFIDNSNSMHTNLDGAQALEFLACKPYFGYCNILASSY